MSSLDGEEASRLRQLPAAIRWIEWLSGAAGYAAALFLGLMAAMMLAEVGARNLFGTSLQVTWELSSYAMAGAFFFGGAYAMRIGGHVRVSALLEALDDRAMRWLDAVVTLVAISVMAYVAASLFGLAWRSISRDVRSWGGFRFPLGIPQTLIALGALQLALQLFARLVRLLLGLPAEVTPSSDATRSGE